MQTEAIEDYLKAIYELQTEQSETKVSTTALAKRLRVAPASATGMLQHLSELGLVTYAPYHGVTLTEEGRQSAVDIIHRHEVIEQYLVSTVGLPEPQAHRDAERWEHLVSPELQHRMESLNSKD